jgi:RNA polymerase sigma-70 factor (ECF subfamily)
MQDRSETPLEQELLVLARSGDTDAFFALVSRHERAVYSLGMHLLGDRDLAEEMLQETFLGALSGLRNFRGKSAFGTWVHRIAANVAYDILKRGERTRLHETALVLGPDTGGEQSGEAWEGSETWEARWRDPDYRVDPETVAVRLERLEWLDKALSQLPDAQRLTVLLHDAMGLTVAEIAQSTKVPVPTAKARLRRGRMALVSLLDNLGYEDRTARTARTASLAQKTEGNHEQ